MFPIHLTLPFGKTIPYYEGIYFLIAIAIGYIISKKATKKHAINPDQFDGFIMTLLVGAIVGGRLSSMLFWNFDNFVKNPLSLFAFWNGGISITGGLAGGILGAWLYGRVKKFPFWKVFAIMSPIVILSQGIGRIGCFLNGDAFGTKTDLPWGVQFPRFGRYFPSMEVARGDDPGPSFAWIYSKAQGWVKGTEDFTTKLHPTQLYELLGDLFIMIFLIILSKKTLEGKINSKVIFFTHIGSYALLRFFLEFIRGDKEQLIASIGITGAQVTLILTSLTCLVLGFIFSRKTPDIKAI